MIASLRIFVLSAFMMTAVSVQAIQLKDLYTMEGEARKWYLGGIYDTLLVDVTDGGDQSQCLEEMGYQGFVEALSEKIMALPEDPNSKERRAMDPINAATFAMMVVASRCQ